MPLFNKYHVMVGRANDESRPRCVFDKKLVATQSYRTLEFRNVSVEAVDEDIDALRAVAAEARSEFERELERRVADAERRGQELGLQEAAQIDAEERLKLTERMQGAVEAFHLALDRAEESTARDALRLGLMVAERLARVVLVESPEAVAANLVGSVAKVPGDTEVRIVASPDLAAQLQARAADILGELGVTGVEIESDESLQSGDLMLFRGTSTLDARVSTRLRLIERSLHEHLGFDRLDGEPA